MAIRDNKDLEVVSGIFSSQEGLHTLFDALSRLNIPVEDLSVLMSEQTRAHYGSSWDSISGTARPFGGYVNVDQEPAGLQGGEAFHQASKLPEGAASGGLTGGIIGAIIGGLTLVGSVLLPGVGLLVAGPLVGAITGGAIGTAAGGLVGALVGIGIPENEAKYYQDSIQARGNVLVVAHVPKNLKNEVVDIYKRCGAQSVKVGG
jgi:hypothetical protein